MPLKHLMEDKQLDFNQPFLSVRRTTTPQRSEKRKTDNSRPVIPRLPSHRSELKSGPLRNPGAVPFLWEQSPGQPKEETRPQARNSVRPPLAPKLPPGRSPMVDQQDSPKVAANTVFTNNQAVNVPCTNDNEKQDVNVPSDSGIGLSHDEDVKSFERSKETREEEGCDSGDSDGEYVDARDTLSMAESSFLNCSMSGLSGLDDINVKPSGNLSMDLQTREFMMDRFLPAAKAMASETTPQYAPKKQPVVQQQPQQPKKTVNHYKPSLRYGPSFADRYSHYHDNEEEEESDDEFDQRQHLPAVCGLLPRFCFKNSLCLLNPVPGMSVRTRVPISSAKKVQPKSSLANSYSGTKNESRSDRTDVKSIDKNQRAELDEDKIRLRNESGQFENLGTSTYQDSSPLFLEKREVISVSEEKMDAGVQGFGFHKNGFKTFQEILDDPVVEKTVYVDTEQKVESPHLRSFSPMTQDTKVVPSSRKEDHEIIRMRNHQMHTIDSSLENLKELQTNDHKLGDSYILSFSDKSAEKPRLEMPQGYVENRDFNLVLVTNKNIEEVTEQEAMEALTLENSHQNYTGLPPPPPLPKSPSDSWLWRTLPSMTTRSSSLRSYLGGPTNHCKEAPTSDMKWETIVKTSKVQRRHLHYSEESLTTIPET